MIPPSAHVLLYSPLPTTTTQRYDSSHLPLALMILILSQILAEVSEGLGEAMVGINLDTLAEKDRLAKRGW